MTSTTSRWLPEPFAVLDDKRGKITVTAWKEQLEEAAKKMAGKGDPAGNRQFWKHFQKILSGMNFSQCESEPCMQAP